MSWPNLKPDFATTHPCGKISGSITVPGDKSISHRVALLASISSGISHVYGFLNSADCLGLLRAMEILGARNHQSRNGDIFIHGTNGRLLEPASPIDLGNSGTAIRLLAGLLAGYDTPIVLTGDESLQSRPMDRIAEPLRQMGATIDLRGARNCAPIHISGNALRAIDYTLPVASAQVKSAILLAALHAEGTTTVVEPAPTRDHTEQIFRALNLPLEIDGGRISIEGFGREGPKLAAREWHIPGDVSSAAFWCVAAAAHRRGSVTLSNVGLNPRRTAVLDVLKRMGARIKVYPSKDERFIEPCGEIRISGGRLKGTVIGGDEIPNLIDEIPILAVAGALAEGETVIKDASELRVKESDRIHSMCVNLRKMGVELDEMDDGLRIAGPAKIRSTEVVDSFGDHRVAMSMAIMALFSDQPLGIKRVECIETSYPGFWKDLEKLGGRVE